MLRDLFKKNRPDADLRRPDLSRIKTGVNEALEAETGEGGGRVRVGGKNYVELPRPEVPDDCYRKCNFCGKAILNLDVRKNLYRCPKCGEYFRVHAYRRVELIADEGSFSEFDREMPFVDPLDFPAYESKVRAAQEKTGLNEAAVCGSCTIAGERAVLCVCDGRFIMSSMGHNVGEKLTRAIETATAERLPLVIYCCSGGARMQEGIISLMQMAKTAAALRKHHDAGLLYISVLTNPTTGGVTASFAMLGDVILAEPKALIGFAGPRVIEQTIGQKLPEGFQRSEFLLEHGFVDRIAGREEQKELLAELIRRHDASVIGAAKKQLCAAYAKDRKKAAEDSSAEENKPVQSDRPEDDGGEPQEAGIACAAGDGTAKPQTAGDSVQANSAIDAAGQTAAPELTQRSAWERVKLSRSADRPKALDYINQLFEHFTELHGDRCFGDDGAVVGGLAEFCGMPVTVIAEQKGSSTKENLHRRFGMPSPEGYRKALRLMKEANDFGRPVICFVDTPGAYPGMESEERGQGEAIARCLYELSGLRVPVLSVVLSEGGSGGALALAVADEVWMLENAVYSILSPEGFASILYKDAKRAQEAAGVMKLTAEDLLKLKVIERIIPEEEPASKETLPALCGKLRAGMEEFFGRTAGLGGDELCARRYERFRKF